MLILVMFTEHLLWSRCCAKHFHKLPCLSPTTPGSKHCQYSTWQERELRFLIPDQASQSRRRAWDPSRPTSASLYLLQKSHSDTCVTWRAGPHHRTEVNREQGTTTGVSNRDKDHTCDRRASCLWEGAINLSGHISFRWHGQPSLGPRALGALQREHWLGSWCQPVLHSKHHLGLEGGGVHSEIHSLQCKQTTSVGN